ncbi:MAG: hypothetical protein HOE53_02010 [Candidatus Magasanikbacteria bacterium]|jgi:hypothetical protein|nr:hypothetical protein [Candidatus Magasanikbacteria bacterium]
MFDDNKQQGGGPAGAPPNLPIGEPEDMFAAMPDAPAVSEPTDQMLSAMNPVGAAPALPPLSADPAQMPEPEPVSARPEPVVQAPLQTEPPQAVGSSALGAGILRPKQPVEATLPPDPMAASIPSKPQPEPTVITAPPVERAATAAGMPAQGDDLTGLAGEAPHVPRGEYTIKEPTLSRGIMTIIIIIIVSTILGAGGWFVYRLVQSSSETPSDSFVPTVINNEPAVPEDPTDQIDEGSTITVPDIVGQESLDEQILYGEPSDTDEDGLSDEEEIRGGTDPELWDTDDDGLSDGDEVLIWSTNATNPDTDGDGYLDGAEVKAGYNPNGPGRFAVPPFAASDEGKMVEQVSTSSEEMGEEETAEGETEDVALSATVETRLRALANANSCTDAQKEEAMSKTIFLYSVQGITLPVEPGDGYALALDPLHWQVDTVEGQDVYADFLKDLLTQMAVCTG